MIQGILKEMNDLKRKYQINKCEINVRYGAKKRGENRDDDQGSYYNN